LLVWIGTGLKRYPLLRRMHLAEWRDAFGAPGPFSAADIPAPRPQELARRSRFAGDRGTDIADHRVNTRSAQVRYDLRSGAEPVVVGAHPIDTNRGSAARGAEPKMQYSWRGSAAAA